MKDKQMTPKKDNNIKININDSNNEQNNNLKNTEDIISSNTPKNKVKSKILNYINKHMIKGKQFLIYLIISQVFLCYL